MGSPVSFPGLGRLGAWLLAGIVLMTIMAVPARSAPAVEPAFEVVWRDRESGQLAWRGFDAAGLTIDAAGLPLDAASGAHAAPGMGNAADGDNSGPIYQKRPLGSLWKLFVYLWMLENQVEAPPYTCSASAPEALRAEEVYCCTPGDSIGRDAALVRSCGLYFAPERLRRFGLTRADWQDFWRVGLRRAPWLADPEALRPETLATPAAIIAALESAPRSARGKAAEILLARAFGPRQETTLVRYMGGRLRVKTFSWFQTDARGQQTRYGGGAGWLTDGTPVWFGGAGTGTSIMMKYGQVLAKALFTTPYSHDVLSATPYSHDALPATPSSNAALALAPGCVNVRLFARHPLVRVETRSGRPATPGELRGEYVARFATGVALPFRANGEISLREEKDRPLLTARLGIDDYVARVLDREADAGVTEAARALSVVIRSYLLNEAERQGNCLAIEDSSHKQRVLPNPPGATARAIAGFTTGLVLSGAPVGYHSTTAGEGRMAWSAAVAAARAGRSWDDILRESLPRAELRALADPTGLRCQPFPQAGSWLNERVAGWNRRLVEQLPGFEPPPAPTVCRLSYGNPFSEQDRNRIHIRALHSLEDRVTLAHEYLHLGLRHHPSGHNEELIERWARQLVGEIYGTR